jgi:hypothetical protein
LSKVKPEFELPQQKICREKQAELDSRKLELGLAQQKPLKWILEWVLDSKNWWRRWWRRIQRLDSVAAVD